MPGEGKAGRDHHPENHKSREEPHLRKDAGHGHPKPERLYPQDGSGRLLPASGLERIAPHGISLQMCSNNLNQYAKAANENGRVYAADLEDLRTRLDELISIGKQILSRLADL